ncbi:unnamed protein product [Urochloa decumbens]|uniref:Uncharacterized protein n=1 Tax=Urochloa decumbens TaxID=240449 RepID=A0ABC9BW39_9POAL
MGFSGSLKHEKQEHKGTPMVPPRVRDPRPTLTTHDMHRFLEDMKRALAGEPGRYDEFVAVMRAFKYDMMGTAGVVNYVEVLLAEHPQLLREFNKFLPWDYIRSHGPAGSSGI